MALTLYVETNFAIGIAKGQDPEAALFLESGSPDVQIVIPGVCFMEALSAWEDEEKQKNIVSDWIQFRIREARRNTASPRARLLADHLEQSGVESENLFYENKARLNEALYRLTEDAHVIDLDPDIMQEALSNEYIEDPTDNLILCSIVRYAHKNPLGHKAFCSSNHNDFDKPDVRKMLDDVGITYFRRIEAALGWLRSRPVDEPGG